MRCWHQFISPTNEAVKRLRSQIVTRGLLNSWMNSEALKSSVSDLLFLLDAVGWTVSRVKRKGFCVPLQGINPPFQCSLTLLHIIYLWCSVHSRSSFARWFNSTFWSTDFLPFFSLHFPRGTLDKLQRTGVKMSDPVVMLIFRQNNGKKLSNQHNLNWTFHSGVFTYFHLRVCLSFCSLNLRNWHQIPTYQWGFKGPLCRTFLGFRGRNVSYRHRHRVRHAAPQCFYRRPERSKPNLGSRDEEEGDVQLLSFCLFTTKSCTLDL